VRIAIVVPFLNEEAHLGAVVSSIERQSRPPERLLLVDDGSDDGSGEIAARFAAEHPYARVLQRPPRPPARDRLATASEFDAFQRAIHQLDGSFDVIAKLDADIELTPETVATVEREMVADERLGIAGAYLSVAGPAGDRIRERCPPYHVRGATKFYRRACLGEIAPIPAILGWDTIDESKARMHGWRTASLDVPGGDPLHRRPTGAAGGSLRAFRRWGACAYASGAHPLWVLLGAARRVADRPHVLGAASYLGGWVMAALRRQPRAEPEVRAHTRREQLRLIRRRGLPNPLGLR
jgi:biofilm PGA synthesis N-glycosyltransferase PgaC